MKILLVENKKKELLMNLQETHMTNNVKELERRKVFDFLEITERQRDNSFGLNMGRTRRGYV